MKWLNKKVADEVIVELVKKELNELDEKLVDTANFADDLKIKLQTLEDNKLIDNNNTKYFTDNISFKLLVMREDLLKPYIKDLGKE